MTQGFSWYPITDRKLIAVINAKVDYDKSWDICRRMGGELLTFSWREMYHLVDELHLLHGVADDYWFGATREGHGMIRWNDGDYFPTRGYNISFNDQINERTCASLQIFMTRGMGFIPGSTISYNIQMSNCQLSKKAVCQRRNWIGAIGVVAIVALILSCIAIVLLLILMCNRKCCSCWTSSSKSKNFSSGVKTVVHTRHHSPTGNTGTTESAIN